jgi:predicted nucleotidyltransferase
MRVDGAVSAEERAVTWMIQRKEELVEALSQNRRGMESLGVRRIGLFGSFARDAQRADSDVDLLVEFEPGRKTFDNYMQLAFLLEDLLQRRVELVTPEALSPHLGPRILAEVEYVGPVA